jgi:small subunit ribosomal protein S20
MANTASAKRRTRANARRTVRNRSVRSAVKTRITRVRRALAEGITEELPELARGAVAGLDRAASKGILHSNNAARRKSRLMRQLNGFDRALSAPADGGKGAGAGPRTGGKKSGTGGRAPKAPVAPKQQSSKAATRSRGKS